VSNKSTDDKKRDEVLKRMLQTKPKQHKDMVAERKAKRGRSKQKNET